MQQEELLKEVKLCLLGGRMNKPRFLIRIKQIFEQQIKTTEKAVAKQGVPSLDKVTGWVKQIRNEKPLKEIWTTFKAKLRGHVQYYGISHNAQHVGSFLYEAKRIFLQ